MQYTSGTCAGITTFLQETDAVYHEMAQHWGLPDSVMGVLYTCATPGARCPLREVCRLGRHEQADRQLRPAADGEGRLIYLEAAGRGKDVCLTQEGEDWPADRPAGNQAENQVFAAWPQADVEQYLALTRRFPGGPGGKKPEGNQGGIMSKASIQLSDHFTCGRLIRFTLPSITMMIFTAVYGVVDSFCVQLRGQDALCGGESYHPGAAGLRLRGVHVRHRRRRAYRQDHGPGDRERANDIFSMIVYVSAAIGVVLAGLGFLILRPAAVLMGAEGSFLEQTLIYGRINLIALPFMCFAI